MLCFLNLNFEVATFLGVPRTLPPEAWAGAGSSLMSLSLALAVRHWILMRRYPSWLRTLIEKRREITVELIFVRAGISAALFQGVQIACFVIAILLLPFYEDWAAASFVGGFVPGLLLKRARVQRVALMERQIEGWLGSLARALEAAPSLGEAIEVSTTMCDAPLSQELEVVVNEMHLGRPLDRALAAWADRVGSRILVLALATLQVGRQTGGNLGVVLSSAADSLREMERLEGVLRTKTAEGRAQAWVISVVPLPLYFAVQAGDPHYFDPLETTAMGHILVAIAAALWMAAIFLARKILAVQI